MLFIITILFEMVKVSKKINRMIHAQAIYHLLLAYYCLNNILQVKKEKEFMPLVNDFEV